MAISVVILTFNAETTIGATLAAARQVSDDVHVVDSYSTDRTLEIVAADGAAVVQHPFENYGAQRNWAIANLALRHDWELHLDADERLSPELAAEIVQAVAAAPAEVAGFYVPRLVHFMGRALRHGGMYPIYHLRLFRRGRGRCEDRRYDQHFQAEGETRRLTQPMIDDIRQPLGEWTVRHNRWADAEVEEILNPSGGAIAGASDGDPVRAKRAQRGFYYRQPLFLRALLLFLYRYILKRGFLDGREGLIFYVLQTFWFRFLIDAKLYERRRASDAR